RCIVQTSAAAVRTARALNHTVAHHGGRTVTRRATPSLPQRPGPASAWTWNVYWPAGRVVYVAVRRSLPTTTQSRSTPSSRYRYRMAEGFTYERETNVSEHTFCECVNVTE